MNFLKKLLVFIEFVLVIVLIVVFYKVLTYFVNPPLKSLNTEISTEGLVRAEFPLQYDSDTSKDYYFLIDGDNIDDFKTLIDNAAISDPFGNRVFNSRNYQGTKKTARFYYSDGRCVEKKFYGLADYVLLVGKDRYVDIGYDGYDIISFGTNRQLDNYYKDENGNDVKYKYKFEFEDLFGPNYMEPWCGH